MKKETVTGAKATVPDYSNGKDGSTTVDVVYDFVYDVIETEAELRERFSPVNLIALANQRLKSTANSGARQKATAPYAPDPNDPKVARQNIIKDMVNRLHIPEDIAAQQVDAMLAAVK